MRNKHGRPPLIHRIIRKYNYHCIKRNSNILIETTGCGAYSGFILPDKPECNYGVNSNTEQSQTTGTSVNAILAEGNESCPSVSCTCTSDNSLGKGTGWKCSERETKIGEAVSEERGEGTKEGAKTSAPVSNSNETNTTNSEKGNGSKFFPFGPERTKEITRGVGIGAVGGAIIGFFLGGGIPGAIIGAIGGALLGGIIGANV